MSSTSRRAYIDWARGLAVLLMIEAHAFDSWTRAADRFSIAFRDATILGGFAAPLFLWLAGLSIPLAVSRAAARLGSRRAGVEAVCRRGLEIFVLAFLFRLQAFIVSPGGPLVSIFRVDILNVMGPAIAAAALLTAWRGRPAALAALYSAVAVAIAMVTPIVRIAPVGALPVWLQWYVHPAGEYTTFTMFPWAGFVFAGGAAGVLLDRVGTGARERVALAGLGAAGIAVLLVGVVTSLRPSIYAQSYFWTSSPTYFAVRVGVVMTALALLFAVERFVARAGFLARETLTMWLDPLATFGRHSLFIYWIHVELVYGYASWLWRRHLPVWGTLLGYAIFVGVIYQAIPLKARVVAWWRGAGRRPSAESVAAA